MAEFTKMVQALKAAGEMTRLRLLALLAMGELSVKDLTDILDQSQPRVSRHLKLLSEAGLVMRNVEGAWVFYRVADSGDGGELVKNLLASLDDQDPLIVADRAALEKIQATHKIQADAYFSEVAQSWDVLRKLHVSESAVEDVIVRIVGPEVVQRMLDVGTGTGRMLELLGNNYAHGTGIDSSREMVAIARAKLSAAKITHAQVKLGDVLRPDLEEPASDLIIVHQVLHFFADPGLALAAISKRLMVGGRILVVDFAPHKMEFLRQENAHQRLGLSENQMQAWAQSAGLTIDVFERHESNDNPDGLVVCVWLFSSH